jgi:hypothetical protein
MNVKIGLLLSLVVLLFCGCHAPLDTTQSSCPSSSATQYSIALTSTPSQSINTDIPSLTNTTIQAVHNPQYRIPNIGVKEIWTRIEFETTVALSSMPLKLPVYKIVPSEVTDNYIAAWGAKFGMEGKITDGLMKDEETGAVLLIFPQTGSIRYGSGVQVNKKPVLPSDSEAKLIAIRFLIDKGLFHEGDYVDNVVLEKLSYGPPRLNVSFKRKIMLVGPGALYSVYLGDLGKVICVDINPLDPADLPVQEMISAKTSEQAFGEMQNRYKNQGKALKVRIDNVTIGYWIENAESTNKYHYVIPVYLFTGQYLETSENANMNVFNEIIEALN